MKSEKINFKDKFYNSFNKIISIYLIISIIILLLPAMFQIIYSIFMPEGDIYTELLYIFSTMIAFPLFILLIGFPLLIGISIFSILIYFLLNKAKSPIKYVQVHNLSLLALLNIGAYAYILLIVTLPNLVTVLFYIILFIIYGKILSKLSKINIMTIYLILLTGIIISYLFIFILFKFII